MLPEAAQARKAIWTAINPHTGKLRIDEAFPLEIRESTHQQEMMIKFRCGSTWQVVGSDNFNSLIGSPPIGIVFSEYSVANPLSWAYLRPILRENGGWALFIYTSRGRNHGATMYFGAKDDPKWFAQLLTVDDTGVLTPEQLAEELTEYKREYGDEAGQALFDQEYYCSFDSAILGAVYGSIVRKLEQKGQIKTVPFDPALPVHTAWDVGFDDLTAIWFWQICFGEIRLIDYHQNSQQDTHYYCEQARGLRLIRGVDGLPVLKDGKPQWSDETIPEAAHRKAYSFGRHWVPHDAANKLMAAGGRSIVNQAWDVGMKMSIIPATSQQNSIEAARATLPKCWIDEKRCEMGISALRSYHFPFNEETKNFDSKPKHDWSSHACDAFEIIGQVWRNPESEKPQEKPRFLHEATADEIFWPKSKDPFKRERI
jgi:phage terminase large subunit